MLSKIIFSARSETLDLKIWNEWKYGDTNCAMCYTEEKYFTHFMTCIAYEQTQMNEPLTEIFGNNHEQQYIVAKEIKRRLQMRKTNNR